MELFAQPTFLRVKKYQGNNILHEKYFMQLKIAFFASETH